MNPKKAEDRMFFCGKRPLIAAEPGRSRSFIFLSRVFHLVCFLFFMTLCFCGWRIAKKFGVVTLDQIFFHLMAPMDGVDKELIIWGIRYSCYTILIIAVYSFMIFSEKPEKFLLKIKYFHFLYRPQCAKWHIFAGTAFLCITIVVSEVKYEAFSYVFAKESSFIKDNYVKCLPEDVHFDQKNNVVILILESMENTYNNGDIFKDPLLPKLQALQKEYLSFSNQRQVYGTGWTIAGLTSYFFGLPLLLFKNQGNILFDKFIQNAESSLEILEYHGYSIEYVLSSSAVFAGTDKMFNTHSHTFIQDSVYLDKYKSEGMTGIWGIPDSFTYQWAKKRYSELSKQEPPFALIVQTIDTHGYDGYVESGNVRYHDFRDVLAAADDMAYDFIEWIKKQENFEHTTIIVLGDHLTGNNPLYKKYLLSHNEKRTIFNMFINYAEKRDSVDKGRLCSSLDMAPTIIESIGGILPRRRLGLGVSLFSEEKTLLEQMGEDTVNSALKRKSDFYKSLF